MALLVHRSERADGLADALADVLADPLEDPFAPEVIAVATRGMERWLTQRLSLRLGAQPGRSDGVAANIAFPFLRRLVDEAIAEALGLDPDLDPWRVQRLTWSVLAVVDEHLEEPWLEALARHLDAAGPPVDASRPQRRLGVARALAARLDALARHRPATLEAWTGADADEDGRPLEARHAWQAEVFRRVRERLADHGPDPAQRLRLACARLREEPSRSTLPPRLATFGLTRLPAGELAILHALGAHRDVHLCALHPSPALWDRLAADGLPPRPPRRRDDPTAGGARHPLLASWGQDTRELQLVLRDAPSVHHPAPDPRDTALGRLQRALREDRPPATRAALDPGDRSVAIHACHGRARQVEVLKDAVLHALADDPTLEPRDVLVLCPDIEQFAPLLHAAFGTHGTVEDADDAAPPTRHDGPPALLVRLADRAPRAVNPVLATVDRLLGLASARVTASQVLDLLGLEPVRRRMGWDDEAVARVEDWIAKTGVRFGLDAAHRAPWRLDDVAEGTWERGLDRIVAGAAMDERDLRLLGSTLPLDDLSPREVELAGDLAELLERLARVIDALATPKPLRAWADALSEAADLLTATAPHETWQRLALDRLLGDLVEGADGDGPPLALGEVRGLLARELAGRPSRSSFRTGALTVCTLHPMRSVPHRVVCLLGLDDHAFPRRGARDGDDPMLADPRVGERDASLEDRQLLLDAVAAATDRLIVLHTGRDERTNEDRPPAVPVGELLDALDAAHEPVDGRPATQRLVVRHPLQPFDRRVFVADELAGGGPWGFEPVMADGARALAEREHDRRPFLTAPLPALEEDVVDLEDLVRFLDHPVRAFLRQRLGVALRRFDDEVVDGLAIELGPLERHHVGERVLFAQLRGVGREAALAAERARGLLPPGVLADPPLEQVDATVRGLVAAAREVMGGHDLGSRDVRVELPDGRLLSGSISGACHETVLTVRYGKVKPKQRLQAWARLLALTATDPDTAWCSVALGRDAEGGGLARVAVPPLGATADERRATALAHLATLLDLRARGLREPVPLACATSAAWAEATARGKDPVAAAQRRWTSGFDFPGEDADPEHVHVHGGVLAFDELLAERAADDERGDGWGSDDRRVAAWAHRVWTPLLEREEHA